MNENKPTKYTKHEKHEKHKLYDSELMKKRGKGKEYNKIREKMEYTNNTFQINFLTPEQKVISNGFIQIKPRNLEISLYGYNDQQKAIRFNDLDFVQISQYKHFKDILSLKYFNMVFYCKFSSLDRVQEFSFLFFTIIRKIIESQETIWKYRLKIIKGFEYTKSSPSSSLSSSKPNKKSDDENKYKVKEKDNSKGKGKIKGKKNINNNNNVEKKKKGEKGNNENPRKLLDLNTNKLFFNTNCPPFETTDFPILVYSPKIKQKIKHTLQLNIQKLQIFIKDKQKHKIVKIKNPDLLKISFSYPKSQLKAKMQTKNIQLMIQFLSKTIETILKF